MVLQPQNNFQSAPTGGCRDIVSSCSALPPQWRCIRSLQQQLKMRDDGWLLLEGGVWKRSRGADRGAGLAAARRMELSAVLKQERNEAVLSESSAALALFTLLLKLYNQTKLIDWQPTVEPTSSHQWRIWTTAESLTESFPLQL